jgi:hypothetical protein
MCPDDPNGLYPHRRNGCTGKSWWRPRLRPKRRFDGNCDTRLLRAYAIQVEALRRLRNGSQFVRVEHAHISEGGQAIIGNGRALEAGLVRQTRRPLSLTKVPLDQAETITAPATAIDRTVPPGCIRGQNS